MWNFDLHDVRAREAWPILVREAKSGRNGGYYYSDLAKEMKVDIRTLRFFLGAIQTYCDVKGLPHLTALVVNRETKLPGPGCSIEEKDLEAEFKRIHAFTWGPAPATFIIPELVMAHSDPEDTDSHFGEVRHYPEGTVFSSRDEIHQAGLHHFGEDGISYYKGEAADSIVLSGGYREDIDQGDYILYTGVGGRVGKSKIQTKDQTLTGGNRALFRNRDEGIPIRVFRGSKGNKITSPKSGYRYDGLFSLENGWTERSTDGPWVYRFELRKIPSTEATAWRNSKAPKKPISEPPISPPTGTDNPPRRVSGSIQRIVRNTKITKWVKELHDSVCQFCGFRMTTVTGGYAEGAHIQPLGGIHAGPDNIDNVLCLCANCHTLFDLGTYFIDSESMCVKSQVDPLLNMVMRQHVSHPISSARIEYHRDRIAGYHT